jgi:hypothetical protein
MEEAGPSCWECEAATSQPIIVVIRTPSRYIASLPLCPTCYHERFLPLTSDEPATLILRRRDEETQESKDEQ